MSTGIQSTKDNPENTSKEEREREKMRFFSLFVSLIIAATTVIAQELPREWIFSVLPLRLFGLSGDGFLRTLLTTEPQRTQRLHRVSQE